jgi:hypothetical protein
MSAKQKPSSPIRWSWLAASLVAGALITTPSLAHKTFLAPDRYVWAVGDTVEIALTSGLAFPDIETGPALDRIAFTSIMLDNQPVSDIEYEAGGTFLNVSFQAQTPGLAVIAMSTLPRFGEISPDDASAYLEEIEADAATHQAFEDLPGTPVLNRSYIKHTKTFICVETCEAGQESSFTPIGQTLEFVAVAARTRTFQLLRDGDLVAGHRVMIYSHNGSHQEAISDADGLVTIDAGIAGISLLSAIWITLPDQADGVYHSDQATLTVNLAIH